MIIARVIGPVVATEKHPSLHAQRLLLVEPKNERGLSLIAVDTVKAGPGDLVLVCREGNGSRQVLQDKGAPVNATIIGIIDSIDENKTKMI
ncbi:MAG TPA: EutN/CcmL family microcompartment protein [Bdellovibrionota bacterium]|nr:EutN/CcmL family microcompartment protein [Bdellovibrionota bacterium]